jgi:hypothetical protein
MRDVVNCYCERCRRFTGHHMAATAADAADVRVDDTTGSLSWHPVPGAAYGFCRACGSSLFWRAEETPGRWSVCAGALDQPTGLRTVEAWWASQAGDYFTRPDLPERAQE